jgi:hypothetical protein
MDVLSSATFFSSNRGQVASKVGHQPDLFAIRADKSDLRTTPHSAKLSCVSQNTPQDIHRAGGAWLVVDACWGSTEKDAKCVAHRPVTQLTHFDLDACVNLLICDDWDVKVDLVAPGVGHALVGLSLSSACSETPAANIVIRFIQLLLSINEAVGDDEIIHQASTGLQSTPGVIFLVRTVAQATRL